MRIAKTKVLISFAVTAKLICVFVFAFAKMWFSHDAAQMAPSPGNLFQEGFPRNSVVSLILTYIVC